MRYNWSSVPSALYQRRQVIAWHDSVANTLNIQVDNGTVSSVSYSGGAKDTTSPMIIGAHSDGSLGFNGLIDELVFCTLFCMSPLYSISTPCHRDTRRLHREALRKTNLKNSVNLRVDSVFSVS